MASRRMKIKTMAKLPSSRPRPVDRPKTPSLMSPGPYGEPPSPSTSLTSPSPSFPPPPPSSPKPSTFPPTCPPSPKPPVVYHIYPPPSPKYNTYDDGGGPVPSPTVLSVSSAGLLSPRAPQSHHNTPILSPMSPSPSASSYVHTGVMSPRRPTTPKTPLSFHGESDRENSQDSFINPPTPTYFSSYSALSPGMGPGIPSSIRVPPSISPGPSTSNPSLVPEENLGGKSAFASMSRPFNIIGVSNSTTNTSSSGGSSDIKSTTSRPKIINKSEMTLPFPIVPRPSTPTTTNTTPHSNSSPSKYNTTPQSPASSSSSNINTNKDSTSASSTTTVAHHHHHHHQPHISNAPNNTDTLRQRLQKGSIAPTTSKYAMIRKEYISKYQNKSPNPKDLTILHYAFFNPPKLEKPPDESLEDEDEIFNDDTELDKDKDKSKTLVTPKPKKRRSSTTPTPTTTTTPTTTSTVPSQTPSTTTDSSLKEINEAEKKESIAPKVKVGPDGQLIIDEQSLVIETSEAKRAKEQLAQMETVSGSNYAVGSSGIYYRKKPFKRGTDWSEKETLKFYRALISCGTDFSMMESVFKHRTRSELKAKFKREDRRNQEQVSRALQKQVFDPSFALTDSEDEKEQEEQIEQIIGKGKGSRKRKSTTEKDGSSAEKISKNTSSNDNVVSNETKTKEVKQRKPRRKSAAIAPPVKNFLVKNPKNGKIDWDLSRSIENDSVDKQTTISNVNNISTASDNFTIQSDKQVESTNVLPDNRTNDEIISKNMTQIEGNRKNITSKNIKKSQTVNNDIDIINVNNANRNENIDASTNNDNSNTNNSSNNNNTDNNNTNISSSSTNNKPTKRTQTTGRKRSSSSSSTTPKPKKSKKETNKRVCTLIQPKKPARRSTRKKSTSSGDKDNQSKVLPQIFRFDAEDPLGLKLVKVISSASMPSLEKEITTSTTTTFSTISSTELTSTILPTTSTSDIISLDSNSGKSYTTLVPSTRKLRKSSLSHKSHLESVIQNVHSNVQRDQASTSSSSTSTIDQQNTNTSVTTPQNPLPIAANRKTVLKRKGTPYRLPGPGPGSFPAPATTLVDEIEIEITCK